MGYCFYCKKKMPEVKIYGICSECETSLENEWNYAMSLADADEPEREVR